MNEQKFSPYVRMDEDEIKDSESEEEVDLAFSPYIDLFSQGLSAFNDESITRDDVTISNDQDEERLDASNLDNTKKYVGTYNATNSIFYDSSDYTALEEGLEELTAVGIVCDSVVKGQLSKGSNNAENSDSILHRKDTGYSNYTENYKGCMLLIEGSKDTNHEENSKKSTVLGEESKGSTVFEENIDDHFKEIIANKNSCKDNSSMEIDVNMNKKIITDAKEKALDVNKASTSQKEESSNILTNREEGDGINESIIQSKCTKGETLRNLHISHDDNDLESDSGFSSINFEKSVQDFNMDEDSHMDSESDDLFNDLTESLQVDDIEKGDLGTFDCNICSQKYKYADDFKNHMSSHGISMFSCNQCGFATEDIILHQQHMAQHGNAIDKNDINLLKNQTETSECNTDVKGFKCKICHFRGERKEDLDSHMKSHVKAYSCENCDFSAYKRLELKRHIMSHVCMKKQGIKKSSVIKKDFFEKSYKCDHCTFTCVYEKDLNQHTKGHFTGKTHNCDVCDYATDNRKYFNAHVRNHTTKPYKCLFCQHSFNKPSDLSHHVILTHTDHKPFKCKYCEYTSKTKKLLTLHLRIHKEKNFICKYCDFSCVQNSDLIIHTFYKHREYCTANTFKCDECGKEFIKQSELRKHLLTHTKKYPNKCPKCDYSCSRKDNLEVHIKRHHTIIKKEKNVKCPQCDYTCFNHRELKTHSVVHTDKRFFSCDLCDYVCRQKKTLKVHQLKEHNAECINDESRAKCINAETKAKCDKCEYVAVDKRELLSHSVVHTGEDFFKCDDCQYVCKQIKALRKHRLKVHGANAENITADLKCDTTILYDMKNVHLLDEIKDEKAFACGMCEFLCLDKNEIYQHLILKHEKVNCKLLKCEICDYECLSELDLEKHIKDHTLSSL